MGFLNNIETLFQKVIEGTFLGNYGGKVQPVEIVKGIWQEILSQKRVGPRKVYVPNFFIITLSRNDFEFVKAIRKSLEEEIVHHISHEVGNRGFSFLGSLSLEWNVGDNIRDGKFFIAGDFIETQREKEEPGPPPVAGSPPREFPAGQGVTLMKLPLPEATEIGLEPVSPVLGGRVKKILLITQGADKDKSYHISQSPIVLGRSVESDLVLGDPWISRRHAVITPVGDDLQIEDLGSRTGTFVNDRKISGKTFLKEGDRISVGVTRIIVRVETA